jgi:hypothetical protein
MELSFLEFRYTKQFFRRTAFFLGTDVRFFEASTSFFLHFKHKSIRHNFISLLLPFIYKFQKNNVERAKNYRKN